MDTRLFAMLSDMEREQRLRAAARARLLDDLARVERRSCGWRRRLGFALIELGNRIEAIGGEETGWHWVDPRASRT